KPAVQRVIGLISGTSADGVDAALVEIQEDSLRPQVRVLAHATYPYDAALRAQILAASYPESSSVDLICHLNVALGECFAAAAIAVAHTAGMPLDQVDLIGSHGRPTITFQRPPRHRHGVPQPCRLVSPVLLRSVQGLPQWRIFVHATWQQGASEPPWHPMGTTCSS